MSDCVRAVSAAFLEELLGCSLCHDRMRQPSSLCCGHSFCRACLRQALRHRRECPICRAPCYTVTDPRPNVALSAILREAFPEDVEMVAEEESLSEPAGSPGSRPGTRVLPLFLSSSVQLPTGCCSMHLFEPRYRLLTQRALDGGGEFAMVWARFGRGFPLLVDPSGLQGTSACVVRIDQSRQTPDGRWNLACRGATAARIEECWVEEGTGELYMARLRVDEADEQEAADRAAAEGASSQEPVEAEAAAMAAAASSSSAGSMEQARYIGNQMHLLGLTARAPAPASPADLSRFAWEAAVAISGPYGWISESEQQALLEIRGTPERLARLCVLYKQALERRWSVQAWAFLTFKRWGPLLGVLMVAWALSNIRSWALPS